MAEEYTKEDERMLKIIMEEVAYIRARLDKHIDDEADDLEHIREEIAKVKEQTAAHTTKFSAIAAGIGVVAAGLVTWILEHLRHS